MKQPGFPPSTPQLAPGLEPFADFIGERQTQYDEAIEGINRSLGLELDEHANRSEAISNITQQRFLDGKDERKPVIGVAGPGAVGKGTMMKHLNLKGYSTNVNVTTRPKRNNDGKPEEDGVEYHFRTEEQYAQEKAEGRYLTATPRPGRGNYAISTSALEDALKASDQGCLVEENPDTLAELVEILKDKEPNTRGVILYVLPPGKSHGREIIEVVERLQKRDPEGFGQETLESTCGKRQMDELASMAALIRKGIEVVFLENDDLEESKQRLEKLFL